MTKVTILGQKPKEEKLKPIQVVGCIQATKSDEKSRWIEFGCFNLSEYKEIQVIKVEGYPNFDCIIIGDRNVYLGYFNDGIVE